MMCSRLMIALAIGFVSMCTIPSYAQTPPSTVDAPKMTALTDPIIRDFYKQSAEIFKEDYSTYLIFTNKSLHPSMSATSETIVEIPGQEEQPSRSQTVNKEKLLDESKLAYETMKNATITHRVKSITIGDTKRTATVVYDMFVTNVQVQSMSANTKGNCTDEIVMSLSDEPQILKSDCKVTIMVTSVKQ